MTNQSCSSEKHLEEKKTEQDVRLLEEQVECLMRSSQMLELLEQTVTLLTSVDADPQTTELLNSTRYSLVRTILQKRLNELIRASLLLLGTLHQASLADVLQTFIEEQLSMEPAQPLEDPS